MEKLGWPALAAQSGVGRIFAVTAIVDAAGSGLFLGSLSILLVRVEHLRPAEIGTAFAIGGAVGLVSAVPMASLANRLHPRRFLVLIMAARGVIALGFLAVDSFSELVAVAVVSAIAIAGVGPAQQALVGELLSAERRVVVMASIRALRNLGYSIAGLAAAGVLIVGGRLMLVLVVLVNAVSFVVASGVYSRLPAPVNRIAVKARRLAVVSDARYLAFTALSTVYTVTLPLLDIGIPLWIAQHTDAPLALAGVALTVNSGIVVALQVRLSRGAETVRGATTRVVQASSAFATSFLLLASAAFTDAAVATMLILVGVVAFTVAEIFESAGWWTLSYEFAPEEARLQYLGTFSLNYGIGAIVGPLAMSAVVVYGAAAWLVLAVVMLCAGALVQRLAATPPAFAVGAQTE